MWARAILATVRRGPWPALLLASLCGWILVAIGGHTVITPGLCGDLAAGRLDGSLDNLRRALGLNAPFVSAWSWFAMSLAMTPPLLAQPVRRLWRGSLGRNRVASVVLFGCGYAAVWMAGGVVLTAAAVVFVVAAEPLALPLAVAIVLAWQVTPLKRACLARAHAPPSLRAFGLGAALDSLGYGARSGVWCFGSCWALMLAPLLVERGHIAAMVLVAVVMFAERHRRPHPIRWSAVPA